MNALSLSIFCATANTLIAMLSKIVCGSLNRQDANVGEIFNLAQRTFVLAAAVRTVKTFSTQFKAR